MLHINYVISGTVWYHNCCLCTSWLHGKRRSFSAHAWCFCIDNNFQLVRYWIVDAVEMLLYAGTVHIVEELYVLCLEYGTIMSVPSSKLAPPPPLPPATVPPAGTKGRATLACGWGGGGANSDDWRESLALCILCATHSIVQCYFIAQLACNPITN